MARATFTRAGRADAARAVERALACLERRAAKIEDGETHARYATDVPEQVSLHARAQQLGVFESRVAFDGSAT